MATIKGYTDLEQSKKLAEILPIESADMCYEVGEDLDGYITKTIYTPLMHTPYDDNYIPCWSLAALLEIIKKLVGYSLQSLDTHTVFMNCELGDKPYNIETENYDNPVDACVEMIEKLHELNLSWLWNSIYQ